MPLCGSDCAARRWAAPLADNQARRPIAPNARALIVPAKAVNQAKPVARALRPADRNESLAWPIAGSPCGARERTPTTLITTAEMIGAYRNFTSLIQTRNSAIRTVGTTIRNWNQPGHAASRSAPLEPLLAQSAPCTTKATSNLGATNLRCRPLSAPRGGGVERFDGMRPSPSVDRATTLSDDSIAATAGPDRAIPYSLWAASPTLGYVRPSRRSGALRHGGHLARKEANLARTSPTLEIADWLRLVNSSLLSREDLDRDGQKRRLLAFVLSAPLPRTKTENLLRLPGRWSTPETVARERARRSRPRQAEKYQRTAFGGACRPMA